MKSLKYFFTRLKAHVKASPAVIAVSILTAVTVAVLASFVIKSAVENDNADKLFKVGVTGATDQKYIGIAIETLNNLDDSRFAVRFEIMDEDEAKPLVRSGELLGYIRVPEGFIKAASKSEFIPVQYVSEGLDTALEESLMKEFILIAENLADVAQKSVFGLEKYLLENGVEPEKSDVLTDSLTDECVAYLLNRNNTVSLDIIGEDANVSVLGYYFPAFSLFFAMLFGIGCAAHLVKRDMSLSKILYSRHTGAVKQVIAENAAYFIFMFCFVFILLAIGGWVLSGKELSSLTDGASFSSFLRFALLMAPAAAMISSMQLFLYECVEGTVSGVLLQFVAAISISYISGYFYPSSFFPQTVQKIALALPGGVAFSYAKRAFSGEVSAEYLLPVLGYAVLFIVLCTVVRKIRLRGDGA